MRNMRYREKVASIKKPAANTMRNRCNFATFDGHTMASMGDIDAGELEEELFRILSKNEQNKDPLHTEMLLNKTFDCRRTFLKGSTRFSEAISKFSHLTEKAWV